MEKISHKFGGIIDRFVGDSILIFFGVSELSDIREDCLKSVEMAIEMQRHTASITKKRDTHGVAEFLKISIGICTGYCTVGNFGSENRMKYTIPGGEVNLARQLEQNTKPGQTLISNETWSMVKDTYHCEKVQDIHVKGVAYPLHNFRLSGLHKEDIPEQNNFIKQGNGFSLALNFDIIQTGEKKSLVRLLENLLAKM